MGTVIENEIRGKLTIKEYHQLVDFLDKKANKVKDFKRFAIRYEPENFRKSTIDLKVRIQDDKAEMIVKLGEYSSAHREEIPVEINTKDFKNAVKLIAAMGYTYGFAMWRFKKTYQYKDIEISVTEILNYGYEYEIEKCTDLSEKESALVQMRNLRDELGLCEFKNESVYYDFCEDVDKNANVEFYYGVIDLDALLDFKNKIWEKNI